MCINIFSVKNQIKYTGALRMLTVAYVEATNLLKDKSNFYRLYKMWSEGHPNGSVEYECFAQRFLRLQKIRVL